MINFCSLRGEYIKNVGAALDWWNESNPKIARVVLGDGTLEIDRSIQILCPFISDLLSSLPLTSCDPVILLPEISSSTFKHLVDLLTTGSTTACQDVEAVVEAANILKIDMDNLVTNVTIKQHADTIDPGEEAGLDLEDGEIVDSVESLMEEPQTEMAGTNSSIIKIAAFSRVFISIPNLINNNSDECGISVGLDKAVPSRAAESWIKCLECDRRFKTLDRLNAHMKTTTKHKKNSRNLKPVMKSNPTSPPWSFQISGQLSTDTCFSNATGVAVSKKGDILVVDSGNKGVQVFHPDRTLKFCFYLEPGKVTQDKIAVCPYSSYIIVLERAPKAQLKVLSQSGNLINVFGNAYLQNPTAFTIDSQDRILVVDEKNATVFIFSLFGELLDRIPCPGLCYPASLEVVRQEMILVSDYQNHCVMVYDFSGTLKRRLGGPGICTRPFGVLMSKSGNVIVADRQAILVKLSVFSLDGQLLGTIKTDIDQYKVRDIALTSDGSLVVLFKDFLSFSNLGDASL